MTMTANKTSDDQEKFLAKLHQGAKATTLEYARELRSKTTKAEQILWSFLRNRQIKGRKFRRQHAIANYIVDFYCHECIIVIELDGNFHTGEEVKEYDKSRTALLNELCITVLRFWNEDVIRDPEKVLMKISDSLV